MVNKNRVEQKSKSLTKKFWERSSTKMVNYIILYQQKIGTWLYNNNEGDFIHQNWDVNRNWSLTLNNGRYKEPDPASAIFTADTSLPAGAPLLICWFLSSRLPFGKWLRRFLWFLAQERGCQMCFCYLLLWKKSVNFLSSTKICCGLGTKYIPIFQPKHLGLMLGPEGPTVLHGFYPWFYPSSPSCLGPITGSHWGTLPGSVFMAVTHESIYLWF